MIRILVADDHAIVRKGLVQIIADTPDLSVEAEAGSGGEVLSLLRNNTFDLVVLDITMPGRSGLEILKEIKTLYPELPVLILSIHPEEQYALRALKAGAAGYLMKDSVTDELLLAIRRISGGRRYITASLAERMADALSREDRIPSHEQLSDRELQVLCLFAKGKRTKEIADDLCLSVKTISTYRSRILSKLGMTTNAEMIRYAIHFNLVD